MWVRALGMTSQVILHQGLMWRYSHDVSQHCYHLKVWLELEGPLLICVTHMAESRRPQFLIIRSWACLDILPIWWLASPGWVIQGTSRWSHNVFSDLALKLTHHLFHSILLVAWVSSRQCGSGLHRAMPSRGSRLLWAILEALTTQGLYIYQQTVNFSVCQRVFKSLLYLQVSLLPSWNCCCAIFGSGSICQRLVYFKEAAFRFFFF